MKINRKVERAVRKALGAAVAGETDRFDSAVAAISVDSDAFSKKAQDLVVAIDSATLFSIHHGDRPPNFQLRRLAREFADYEDWSGIDAGRAHTYLRALADEDWPLEALAVKESMLVACAIGGWLLSAFIPDDVEWTDFLDGILDKVEWITPTARTG